MRALKGQSPLPGPEQAAEGSKWCQQRVKRLGPWDEVRRQVAVLELTPYHFAKFTDGGLLPALASSRVANASVQEMLFPDAIGGRRVVICMWGAKHWGCARPAVWPSAVPG